MTDIRVERAGTIAGVWFAGNVRRGHDLIAAGQLMLAGPVDLDELDRWMRIGWERRRGATVPYGQPANHLARTDRGGLPGLTPPPPRAGPPRRRYGLIGWRRHVRRTNKISPPTALSERLGASLPRITRRHQTRFSTFSAQPARLTRQRRRREASTGRTWILPLLILAGVTGPLRR